MKSYRIEVSQTVQLKYKEIDVKVGEFRVTAKNADEAADKALELAKNLDIDSPLVTDIICEEIIFVL